MDRPVIDHRSPEFAQLTEDARVGLRTVFGTVDAAPMLYPASGTGATEAALVNALRPGDRVLAYNYGLFSGGMGNIARKFGYEVDDVVLRWGDVPSADDVERRLRADSASNPYQAILICHNETSTGVTADVAAIHEAIRASGHDALFIVDTVSSLASIPFHMDQWSVDIVICGSQKGLMLPPGLGILGVSRRALEVAGQARWLAASLLGLGAHHARKPHWAVPVYARDAHAVRSARGATHAGRRGRPRQRVCPPPAAG